MLLVRYALIYCLISLNCDNKPMTEIYKQDETFERVDFSIHPLQKGEYEHCVFHNCNFANHNLSAFAFMDCVFNACNLSLVKILHTAFRDVQFKDCKMLGLRFDECHDFGLSFSFDNCQLHHSSFYK